MELITSENILLIGSVLLIAGVLIGKTGYRTGLPILLVFLLVGMAFGTDGVGIKFSDMHTAQFIGMIALCIILFSGGMNTRISDMRPVLVPGLMLSTVGVLLTATVTGLFIWWLSGMAWTNIHFAFIPSLLLAATMSSTDSASVFGILGGRKVTLRNNLKPMLELESGSNDPMAYMLTVILIQMLTIDTAMPAWNIISDLFLQFFVGGIGGYLMGKFTLRLIKAYTRIGRKASAEENAVQATSMSSILMIGCVFFTFALTTDLSGNGYLAVYICGIVAGNSRLPHGAGISKFVDSLTWLAQIVVFLMLGLLVNPHEMLEVAAVSLLIGLFMIIVGRPLSVFLSLSPLRGITSRSKLFISWVGLRGAVPIIFATYPVVAGIDGAGQIFNIVFFVTLMSLLVQGTTVISSARRLGLIDDDAAQEEDFGVELAEGHPTSLQTIIIDPSHLVSGNTLRDMHLSDGMLVMMIRRGGEYIVPNGSVQLQPGDKLLIIKKEGDV